jgi:hypothetical protein
MPTSGRRAPARARKSTPDAKLRKKAQALSAAALETLARIMAADDVPPPVKLAAAREVLDRGHGRPKLGAADERAGEGMTVIVKRFSDITPKEEAAAAATEADE